MTRKRVVPNIPPPPAGIDIEAYGRIDMAELAQWKPAQIDALFGGIAKVVDAAKDPPVPASKGA